MFLLSSVCLAQLFRFKNLHPDEIKKTVQRIAEEEIAHHQRAEIEVQPTSVTVEDTEPTEVELETIDTEPQIEEEPTVSTTNNQELTQLEEVPVEKESFAKEVVIQIKEFFIGFRFIFLHPYSALTIYSYLHLVLTLIFIKAIGSAHWGSLDFVFLKMCYEVFQPEGQIVDAAWTYGVYRGLMGFSAGLTPVLVERSLPNGYGAKTMRSVIVICFGMFIVSYVILMFIRNVYSYFAAAIIINAFSGTLWNMSMALIQQKVPNNFLGRVMSVDIGFNLNVMQTITFAVSDSL